MPSPSSSGAPKVQFPLDPIQPGQGEVEVKLESNNADQCRARFADESTTVKMGTPDNASQVGGKTTGRLSGKQQKDMTAPDSKNKSLLKRIGDLTGLSSVRPKALLTNMAIGAVTGFIVGGFVATIGSGGLFAFPAAIAGGVIGAALFGLVTAFALNDSEQVATRQQRADNDVEKFAQNFGRLAAT